MFNIPDTSKWLHGEWTNEPLMHLWKSFGLPCLIMRTPFGHLCGYVGVKSDHPYFNMKEVDSYELNLHVHGGITFGAKMEMFGPEFYWLGFDCAHLRDYSPYGKLPGGGRIQDYKNFETVKFEVQRLADQISQVKQGELT